MTDKDLLSINEAYAASQKAVKEPVNEGLPAFIAKKALQTVGTAIIKKALKKDDTEEEASEEVKCEHCNGTGKHGEQDCTKCEGTGIITINAAHCNEKATDQRPKDEVNADEVSKDVGDVKGELQEPVEAEDAGEEKKTKKEEKLAKESINNSNKGNIMSEDKSIFDKLYESVMGEDDDFELGIPGEDDGLDMGDDAGEEEGGDVTVTLTADQADCLKAIIDQLGGGDDEEEAGDVDEDEPLAAAAHADEESVQEDTTHTKDGSKPGVDPSDGGGITAKAHEDGLGGKSSGDGSQPVTDEISGGKDTGEGKKPGHAKNAGKPGKQAV